LVNGHLLSSEDIIIRKNILELMCENETILDNKLLGHDFIISAFSRLQELEADGLVTVDEANIHVTSKGKSFIRNICVAIDARLWREHKDVNTFSKAI